MPPVESLAETGIGYGNGWGNANGGGNAAVSSPAPAISNDGISHGIGYGDGWENVRPKANNRDNSGNSAVVQPSPSAPAQANNPAVPSSPANDPVLPSAPAPLNSPAPAPPSGDTVKHSAQISFNENSNAGRPGLYLKKGVWGTEKDEDVLKAYQSILDVYADLYGGEYVMRKALHTVIKSNPSGNSNITYDLTAIGINAADADWPVHVRSFSHELYHYTSTIAAANRRHQWFEETIASMHSLYVLDELAITWGTDDTYSDLRNYADALSRYSNFLMTHYDLGLSGSRLAAYYKDNRAALEDNPYTAVSGGGSFTRNLASILYKEVFKDSRDSWGALKVLHSMGNRSELTFGEYINEWYDRCGRSQKETVKKIADIMGIILV
jgi:hypothetical protein